MNMTKNLRISGCYGKGWMEMGGEQLVGTTVSHVLRTRKVGERKINTAQAFNTNKIALLTWFKNLSMFCITREAFSVFMFLIYRF